MSVLVNMVLIGTLISLSVFEIAHRFQRRLATRTMRNATVSWDTSGMETLAKQTVWQLGKQVTITQSKVTVNASQLSIGNFCRMAAIGTVSN